MLRFVQPGAPGYSFDEYAVPSLRLPDKKTMRKAMAVARFSQVQLSPENGYPDVERSARLDGLTDRVPVLSMEAS